MIWLLAAFLTAELAPATPATEPAACIAFKKASEQAMATIPTAPSARSPVPGKEAQRLIDLNDEMAVAMRADFPNFKRIADLMRETTKLRISLSIPLNVERTECEIARLQAMSSTERTAALKRMAAPTRAEREKWRREGPHPVAPPAPPPPKP